MGRGWQSPVQGSGLSPRTSSLTKPSWLSLLCASRSQPTCAQRTGAATGSKPERSSASDHFSTETEDKLNSDGGCAPASVRPHRRFTARRRQQRMCLWRLQLSAASRSREGRPIANPRIELRACLRICRATLSALRPIRPLRMRARPRRRSIPLIPPSAQRRCATTQTSGTNSPNFRAEAANLLVATETFICMLF